MKLLITGVCGFAGSTLGLHLREADPALEIIGVDNFMRPGSELNRARLRAAGIRVQHADLRIADDLESLPAVDCVLDAAANPSVLAGTGPAGGSSRLLMQHNLVGTINMLEFCKTHHAAFILLSTSRVYSIPPLAAVKLEVHADAFRPIPDQTWPHGLGPEGISEEFSTASPVSLYGATKICSEALALEYGATFGFPVWINRLGVLAGAGQFGKADQGIFSFWINSCARRRPLRYIGFGGQGYQVRDCIHPADLVGVLARQMKTAPDPGQAITNFSGGILNSMSLCQLHAWSVARFGPHAVAGSSEERPFDIPWMVLDSSLARTRFGWQPSRSLADILEEIAIHAEQNPDWLDSTTS
ncbi:MAG: NAD-dependent epimerase/dehydratase family protein [Chthoniobacteraceae bacterium]